MKSAEISSLNSLGATPIIQNKSELLESIKSRIDLEFSHFDGNKMCLLKTLFPEFSLPNNEDVTVPFLNLKPKPHKMKDDDIKAKRVDILSFRPVVDQSCWILKPLSLLLLQLLTALKFKTLEIFSNILPDPFVKNGHEVQLRYKSIKLPPGNYNVLFSADLSNAYSEVHLSDLEEAVLHLGEATNLCYWKIELTLDLSRLILQNNYVESSQGIFKLQECLPMGMPASPAGLDIVGLSSEVKRFQTKQFKFTELPSNLKSTLNCSLEKLVNYTRYQDDTNIVASSTEPEDLKNLTLNIGTLFSQRIPVNIDLFHIYGSFLDVVFLRKLSSGKIETFPKKKLTSPVTFIHSKSMSPTKHKYSTIFSELVRIRRICSKPSFIPFFDHLLAREFRSLGYTSIEKKIKKLIEEIRCKFDEKMFKIPAEKPYKRIVYGSTVVLDSVSNSHNIVRDILKSSLAEIDVTLPMKIPSKKLKTILHTKNRYLAKMK